MPKESLDKVLKDKVEPMVQEAMHRFMGITVPEISSDITDSIEKNPMISYNIDTSLSFKQAKRAFKKEFLKRMLQTNLGNVSLVAKVTGLDRRTIHRDIRGLNIDVKKIRNEMIRTEYYQKEAVDSILRNTLDNYKQAIQPQKLEKMYEKVGELSEDIVKTLPLKEMQWDDAEKEFEKEFIKKALAENNGNVSLTARKIRLRYETLHRKIKKLGIGS
jgi:DNA-binding NtrC family response regulator